jgi:hypothetical protein
VHIYIYIYIYIGFETLKVKCTQYGICSQAAFKNARAIFFWFSGGAGIRFRAGLKKFGWGQKFRGEGCPPPGSDTLKVRRGYFNVPPERRIAQAFCSHPPLPFGLIFDVSQASLQSVILLECTATRSIFFFDCFSTAQLGFA